MKRRPPEAAPTCPCGAFDHVAEEHKKFTGTALPAASGEEGKIPFLERGKLPELDLHQFFRDGQATIETKIDQFLAAQSKARQRDVCIIHGKGNGTLAKVVKKFLRIHLMVKDIEERSGSCIVELHI